MYQPCSSTGQPAGPLQPPAPKPVLTAAKLMALAASRGKDWARILFTVLFTLASLQLTESRGIVQVFTVALTWLIGLAAVWLLWRPACSTFFKPQRFV
jgi:uncharacterized membrane protein YccC